MEPLKCVYTAAGRALIRQEAHQRVSVGGPPPTTPSTSWQLDVVAFVCVLVCVSDFRTFVPRVTAQCVNRERTTTLVSVCYTNIILDSFLWRSPSSPSQSTMEVPTQNQRNSWLENIHLGALAHLTVLASSLRRLINNSYLWTIKTSDQRLPTSKRGRGQESHDCLCWLSCWLLDWWRCG